MFWNEVHITTSAEKANEISDKLIELGAQAVTFQDAGDTPIFEPTPDTPLWEKTIVIGLFENQFPLEAVIDFLEKQSALGIIQHYQFKQLKDENWERRCLEGFHPIAFGKRLWICPSWCQPPDIHAVNIRLDPGLAFGTGTHPTTALCLEWLDENIHSQNMVVDYGCGSGILGIAAFKLGAKKVIAVDNDPQALTATLDNCKRNEIDLSLFKIQSPEQPIEDQADLIIANILAKPLLDLAPFFSKILKPGGKIILSGILVDQVDLIKMLYNQYVSIINVASKQEWARIEGVRK